MIGAQNVQFSTNCQTNSNNGQNFKILERVHLQSFIYSDIFANMQNHAVAVLIISWEKSCNFGFMMWLAGKIANTVAIINKSS